MKYICEKCGKKDRDSYKRKVLVFVMLFHILVGKNKEKRAQGYLSNFRIQTNPMSCRTRRHKPLRQFHGAVQKIVLKQNKRTLIRKKPKLVKKLGKSFSHKFQLYQRSPPSRRIFFPNFAYSMTRSALALIAWIYKYLNYTYNCSLLYIWLWWKLDNSAFIQRVFYGGRTICDSSSCSP